MRAFALFVGLFVLAGVIAACLAYPAYEFTSTFAAWPFHRVAGRIAMLVLALELVAFCRLMQLRTKADFGYGLPWRVFLPQIGWWLMVGSATAALGAAFLFGTRLRLPDPGFVASPTSVGRLLLIALSSGLTVALIEETVMRGIMHTTIERESGPWVAALLTAPLFAVTHFFAKVRIPPDEIAWRSGFDLLSRSFEPLTHGSLVLDSFLSWLAVGLVLSLTRVLTGNIAVAIGLHAGWVVILRLLQEASVRGTSPAYGAWVSRMDGLLGFWLLPWAAAIAAVLWITRALWVPYAVGASASGASRSRRSMGSSSSR